MRLLDTTQSRPPLPALLRSFFLIYQLIMQISQASLQGGRVRVQPSASLQQGGAAIRSCGTWNCFLFIWMSDPGRCRGGAPSHKSWRPGRREAGKETCAWATRRGEEGIINAIPPCRMDSEFRISAFWPTAAPSHPFSTIWKHFVNRHTRPPPHPIPPQPNWQACYMQFLILEQTERPLV